MKFAFIDAERADWPVSTMCAVLDVSRAGFYSWRERPESERRRRDRVLALKIEASHPRAGAPTAVRGSTKT